MSKILITGATGHIGCHLVPYLLNKGNEVIAIGRNNNRLLSLRELYPSVSTILCDLSYTKKVSSINIEGAYSLVHLAGFVPKIQSTSDMVISITDNIISTVNVMDILGKRANYILLASTVGVYASNTRLPINEFSRIAPVNHYSIGKYISELYTREICKKNKNVYSIMRFSNVYGEGETIHRAIPNFINSVLRGEPPVVSGDAIRDFTYISDAISAISLGLDMQCDGTYNISSGIGSKIRDIAEYICSIDGKELKPIYNAGDDSKRVYDISLARKYLGYSPEIKIEEGIRREYKWIKQSILT